MKRFACLTLLLLTSTGCKGLMHELQPHRLWRMNYQEPVGRTDGVYFSVSDPLTQESGPTPLDELSAPPLD